MKYSRLIFFTIIMAITFSLLGQPAVQAGQNLTIWPIDNERGDSSTGSLTIYYEVVGWDNNAGEELVLMFFFLRIFEKKTKTWHLVSAVADTTLRLTTDVVTGLQQQKLVAFLNGPVRARLGAGYTAVHLTGVENDFENLTGNIPPYTVGADITIVAK